MTLAPLSRAEREWGWVEYHCPVHGGLVAGPATLGVACRCGKKAAPTRDGKPVPRQTLHDLRTLAERPV